MEEKEEKMDVAIFSNDPQTAMTQAQSIVSVIADKCKGPKFVSMIKGNKYPKVEWWATVGASLSLSPYIVEGSVQPIMKNETVWGFRARAEIRDIRFNPPKPVASAEASVTRDETLWKDRDVHALESMAQTRAVSKAYRVCLPFIAVLAGLEATGAEEMQNGNKSKPIQKTKSNKLTEDQRQKAIRMHEYMEAKSGSNKGAEIILDGYTNEFFNKPTQKFNDLTGEQIDQLWDKLSIKVEEFDKATKGK